MSKREVFISLQRSPVPKKKLSVCNVLFMPSFLICICIIKLLLYFNSIPLLFKILMNQSFLNIVKTINNMFKTFLHYFSQLFNSFFDNTSQSVNTLNNFILSIYKISYIIIHQF